METFNGFRLEKRGDIYIYHIFGIGRAAVDDWYKVDGDQTKAVAAISNHAFRVWVVEKLVFPTPYLSSKADLAVKETPEDLFESTALVISHPVAFRAMSLFLTRMLSQRKRTEFRIFQHLDDALRWLEARREHVAKTGSF